MQVLQTEAKRQHTSPSALLNDFVVSYAEYGRFVDQMGAISLSRQTLTAILDATQDDTLTKAAEQAGRSAVPAYIGAMQGRLTKESIHDFMEVLSRNAHLFQFNESNDGFGPHWTLVHELGSKWSTFLAHYFGEAFRLAKVPVHHEKSERSVIFWFD